MSANHEKTQGLRQGQYQQRYIWRHLETSKVPALHFCWCQAIQCDGEEVNRKQTDWENKFADQRFLWSLVGCVPLVLNAAARRDVTVDSECPSIWEVTQIVEALASDWYG